MFFRALDWLKTGRSNIAWQKSGSRSAARRTRRLRVERLEERQLLTTLPAGFQEIEIADGLNPTGQDFAPDGRILVANKGGTVTVITAAGQKLSTPFVSVAVDTYRDRGLTAVAVDPLFAQNRYVYIFYTAAVPNNPNAANNGAPTRLVRLTASASNPNLADPNSAVVLLDNIPSPAGIHTGGFLHFGTDGMLYVGVGEGDVRTSAQDLSNIYGKVLRLDVHNYPNIIPPDNPFAGQPNQRGEIWAYGFRNPFSGDIDPASGDILVNDVGNATWEEVDRLVKGANYGWPLAEGNSTNPSFTNPLFMYNHDGSGAAATGGAFYRGNAFPASYYGQYFVGDVVTGTIRLLDPATGQATTFATDASGTTDLDIGPDGNLYRTQIFPFGAVFKITFTGSLNRPPRALATADKTAGLKPLTVNFSGAGSSDPDNDSLTYSWDFGDGTAGTGVTAQHTYTVDGTYSAVLTVSDRPTGGLTSSAAPIAITVGNRAPAPAITTPVVTDKYIAGTTITFSGMGSDPEDGNLPASAFHWSFLFGHNTHFHDFVSPIDGVTTGTFFIPTGGETDPDQYYRILLTVTDSQGLQTTVFRDIRPLLATFTLASNLAGATLLLDGSPVSAGTTTTGVVGMVRTLEAPATQVINGVTYPFVGWSDGGAPQHAINTSATPTIYTATYGPGQLSNGFEQELVAGGLYEPTSMVVAPDGRIFVTEKPYGVRVVSGGQVPPTPFLSLSVEREGERGVWGIALDPHFATNGYVYVYYTHSDAAGAFNRLSRFTVSSIDPNVADPTSELVLIDGIPTASPGWYNGGLLQFGADGMLYVGIGDTMNTALPQDLSKLQGKILRISPNATGYTIPADNPFVNTAGARGEIWAYGFHNPATGTMLPGTSRLFVNDIGNGAFAEVDEVLRGGNFGWPQAEGPVNSPGLIDPTYGYASTDTQPAVLKGSVFFTGKDFPPEYEGKYFAADFVRGTISTVDLQTGEATPFLQGILSPIAIANSPDGNLYWLSHGGVGGIPPAAIFKVHPVQNQDQPPTPTIDLPGRGLTYQGGQQITLNGSGTDAEDGTLPASALEWKVEFHHADHAHAFIDSVPGTSSVSFTIPLVGETDPDQFYRVYLTATDSDGVKTTTFTDILPELSTFTLMTNPPGGALLLDGQAVVTPVTITGVIGMTRTIAAPAQQLIGPTMYRFTSWSDGGAATHTIATPAAATGTTFVANFQAATLAALYVSNAPTEWPAGKSGTYQVTVTNVGTQTWLYSGTRKVRLGVYFGGESDAVGAWPTTPQRFAMTRDIPPGDSYTFNVKLSAPTTPGNYILRDRLVREGPGTFWFDTIDKVNVLVGTMTASYTATPPKTWTTGQTQSYSITVTNTGSLPWRATGPNRVRLAVWFGGSSDTPPTGANAPIRFALPADVAPGESATVLVTLAAPLTAGKYTLRNRLVHEWGNYFAVPNLLKTSVTVSAPLAAKNGIMSVSKRSSFHFKR